MFNLVIFPTFLFFNPFLYMKIIFPFFVSFRDLLKNLRSHKDEDLLKGQAVKNQKVLCLHSCYLTCSHSNFIFKVHLVLFFYHLKALWLSKRFMVHFGYILESHFVQLNMFKGFCLDVEEVHSVCLHNKAL